MAGRRRKATPPASATEQESAGPADQQPTWKERRAERRALRPRRFQRDRRARFN